MSRWSEIRDDFFDEEERCVYIDAWRTDNDDEEGDVIAKVYVDTPKVEYLDERARTDAYAQEVIDEVKREILNGMYR